MSVVIAAVSQTVNAVDLIRSHSLLVGASAACLAAGCLLILVSMFPRSQRRETVVYAVGTLFAAAWPFVQGHWYGITAGILLVISAVWMLMTVWLGSEAWWERERRPFLIR